MAKKPSRPRLGQHFLSSPRYRDRILAALDIGPDDLVIEIGPGRGAMTEALAGRAAKVVAIEVDAPLARQLQERLAGKPNVEILHADVLASDLAQISLSRGAARCAVFGNLPYYITSPILHHVLGFADAVRAMAFVVQVEVAERLAAAPGSRAYGYLSVYVQLHAEPHIVFRIPPGAFSPPPKVHSALVSLNVCSRFPAGLENRREEFLRFIKRCFAQKRKNLLNNLGGAYGRDRVAEALAAMQLPLTARAEELNLEHFGALFQRLT